MMSLLSVLVKDISEMVLSETELLFVISDIFVVNDDGWLKVNVILSSVSNFCVSENQPHLATVFELDDTLEKN